jgi:hypothetical protein
MTLWGIVSGFVHLSPGRLDEVRGSATPQINKGIATLPRACGVAVRWTQQWAALTS